MGNGSIYTSLLLAGAARATATVPSLTGRKYEELETKERF